MECNLRKQLAAIHIAKKELGLDDDTYRLMLREVGGVDSAKCLDARGCSLVLDAMRAKGWKGNESFKPRQPEDKHQTEGLCTRQADKIRALWLSLADNGTVKDPSLKAMRAFVKRMTGIDHENWLPAQKANIVIEALKAWKERRS